MYIGKIQQLIASIGPYFLHGKQVGGFLEAVAATLDESIQTLEFGLRLSQPLRCPEEVLPVIASDRGIRLYPAESVTSKRLRLSQWLRHRRGKGTHRGELEHAQPYFLPGAPVMRIVHQTIDGAKAVWHTLDASGVYSVHQQTPSNWNWDNHPEHWSRWWAIIYAPESFLSLPHYGDGTCYGDGTLYAGAATEQIALDILAMFTEWKASHSMLWGIILTDDATLLDPTLGVTTDPAGWTSHPAGNWAQPMLPSGGRTRAPTAYFILDRGNPP